MSAAATPADVLAGNARWCVVEGDALANLAALLPQSLDAIITDPPYASTGDAASIMKIVPTISAPSSMNPPMEASEVEYPPVANVVIA